MAAAREYREGAALVQTEGANDVFFNPTQVFNRDLSLIAIKAFARRKRTEMAAFVKREGERAARENRNPKPPFTFRGLSVIEPLGATGLRSLRYALELPKDDLCRIVCGDIDRNAVETIKKNRALNGMTDSSLIAAVCADGIDLMNATRMPDSSSSQPLVAPTEQPAAEGEDAGGVGPTKFGKPRKTLPAGFKVPPTWGEDLMVHRLNRLRDDALPFGCQFDVVDIDPYGSCAEFLDSAVRSTHNGGLLCLTSTDMMILCGKDPGVAFYKYGGNAVKTRAVHELSLRLLLNAVTMTAARYRRVAVPLMSCSVDFYVRVFVEIRDSPLECKKVFESTSLLLQCVDCDNYHVLPFGTHSTAPAEDTAARKAEEQLAEGKEEDTETGTANAKPKLKLKVDMQGKLKIAQMDPHIGSVCKECGGRMWLGGPMYSGPLHDQSFVDLCLEECLAAGVANGEVEATQEKALTGGGDEGGCVAKTEEGAIPMTPPLTSLKMIKKIRGLLTLLKEELKDCPMYINLPSVCHNFGVSMVKPLLVKSALMHLGYRVSHFHREPQAIKTDAPCGTVFDIVRYWIQSTKAKVKDARLPKALSSRPISLEKEVELHVLHPDLSTPRDEAVAVPRWLPNPEPHWGPGKRAKPRQEEAERTAKKQKTESEAGGCV